MWDFGIAVVDRIYNLFKKGFFFSALLLGMIGCLMVVLVRLPSQELGAWTKFLLLFLQHERFYFLPLSGLLGISLVGNVVQKMNYGKEIKRLTEVRSLLMHERAAGTMGTLKDHRTSKRKDG